MSRLILRMKSELSDVSVVLDGVDIYSADVYVRTVEFTLSISYCQNLLINGKLIISTVT